jgi:uncharacterized membrane protein YphA (DoxX/SURF4 family)
MDTLGRLRLLCSTVVGLLLAVAPASAHIQYVTEEGGSPAAAVEFVTGVVAEPLSATLLAVGSAGTLLGAAVYLRVRPARRDLAALRVALAEYDGYLPWMLRLSLGLPLVGAGFAGYLFSPAVPVEARLLQVGLGFLLLFGLATRAVAAVGLAVYLGALAVHPSLLLAGEYAGGFLAVLLLGSGRPSADHLLQRVGDADGYYGRVDPVHDLARRFNDRVAPYERYAPLALRLSVGVTFAFLGVWEKLAHPGRALAVVEKYDLTAVVPVSEGLWVLGAGAVEAAVGLLLIVGLFTRGTAAVAFLTLTLTLFGLPDDPVLAHVTLFGLTSALFVTGGGPLSVDRWLARRTGRRGGDDGGTA